MNFTATNDKPTLDLEHISVGDIFRWNIQHHTKLGAQVRRSVAAGELVSDDLVAAVVHRRLSEHDWNYGFVIDGFPRNQPQARSSWRARPAASTCTRTSPSPGSGSGTGTSSNWRGALN